MQYSYVSRNAMTFDKRKPKNEKKKKEKKKRKEKKRMGISR